MPKLDLRKDLRHFYDPPRNEFTFIDVPPMNFLMIDGRGSPGGPEYQAALEALYGMSYTLKFAMKRRGTDYTVSPLEGLWWMEDMAEFSLERRDDWLWTAMIMQPPAIAQEHVDEARAELARKKNPPSLPRLRFETFHEGLSVQIMYLGAYADEGPTIARMHGFIKEQGYELQGKHHEIYLGDPRRTAPDRLRTVIRQPVQKQG